MGDSEAPPTRVVVPRKTAEWLFLTFGLPGFGTRDAGAPPNKRKALLCDEHGEPETGEAIESYKANDVTPPVSFKEHMAQLREPPPDVEAAKRAPAAPPSSAKSGSACEHSDDDNDDDTDDDDGDDDEQEAAKERYFQQRAMVKAFLAAVQPDEEFRKAIRAAAKAASSARSQRPALFRKFEELLAADTAHANTAEAAFVCVDLEAFAPLFTGEALRFDVLPRLVHAAGWATAPGADRAEAWYTGDAKSGRKKCDAAQPPERRDKPVPRGFRPEFGYIWVDDATAVPDGRATLCMRPYEERRDGEEGDGRPKSIWWGSADARYEYSSWAVGFDDVLANLRDLQPAFGVIGRPVTDLTLCKLAHGDVAAAIEMVKVLEDVRKAAIKGHFLHRVLPYPQKLSAYRHPVKPQRTGNRVVVVAGTAWDFLWDR